MVRSQTRPPTHAASWYRIALSCALATATGRWPLSPPATRFAYSLRPRWRTPGPAFVCRRARRPRHLLPCLARKVRLTLAIAFGNNRSGRSRSPWRRCDRPAAGVLAIEPATPRVSRLQAPLSPQGGWLGARLVGSEGRRFAAREAEETVGVIVPVSPYANSFGTRWGHGQKSGTTATHETPAKARVSLEATTGFEPV
jgi:hypothetical protein